MFFLLEALYNFMTNQRSGMKGFKDNIRKLVEENNDFRRVIYTAPHSQIVLMSLRPTEEIGMEVHEKNDQFFQFVSGEGKLTIDGTDYSIEDCDGALVPAGTSHNVINTSETAELKLYTMYAPPHHKNGIVRATKEEAEDSALEFDGQTTE